MKINTIVDRVESVGNYSVKWDGLDYKGRPVATGLYLYQIRADNFTETRKMLLIK